MRAARRAGDRSRTDPRDWFVSDCGFLRTHQRMQSACLCAPTSLRLTGMPANCPVKILVAGGGVSGLETVLALQSLAPGRFDIDVLAPERHFVHRPPTTGAPFEPIRPFRTELSSIAEDRGFHLTRDALDRVDAAGHHAVTQGGN